MPNNYLERSFNTKEEYEAYMNDPLVKESFKKHGDAFLNPDIKEPHQYVEKEPVNLAEEPPPAAEPEPVEPEGVVERASVQAAKIPGEAIDAPKQLGRGVVHGTMGIAQSIGTGSKYLGARLNKPLTFGQMVPSEKAEVIHYESMLKKEGVHGKSARVMAVNKVNKLHMKVSQPFAHMLESQGKIIEKYWGESMEPWSAPDSIKGKNVWDDWEMLGSPTWWAYNVGNMLPSLAASMLPGAAAQKGLKAMSLMVKMKPAVAARIARLGGSIVGGGAGGSLEGAATYRSVLENGGTEQEAANAAQWMTAFSAGLNAISLNRLLNKASSGFMTKIKARSLNAFVEGTTEALEEPFEVFAKAETFEKTGVTPKKYDPVKIMAMVAKRYLAGGELPEDIEKAFEESLKEAATVLPVAAVAGGGMSTGPTTEYQKTVKNVDKDIKQSKKELKKLKTLF